LNVVFPAVQAIRVLTEIRLYNSSFLTVTHLTYTFFLLLVFPLLFVLLVLSLLNQIIQRPELDGMPLIVNIEQLFLIPLVQIQQVEDKILVNKSSFLQF